MSESDSASVDSPMVLGMQNALHAQREAYLNEGDVTAETRIDRIDRCIDAILKYTEPLQEALNKDFTCRPRQVSLLSDVAGSISAMKHARKHLRSWMKDQKRPSLFPLGLLGARSRIKSQPLGVVAIIAPWNFPVSMVFQPMAGALAAGNRVMIKPSEFTPATSEVLSTLIADAFDPKEVSFFTGGPEVGQAFSSLPFDHLLFTGATSVARHIMTAAAQNLVPLTLELGGKCPVILSRTANLKKSIERIMFGKTINAGQICLAPDYLMVAEENLEEVLNEMQTTVKAMYPTLLHNEQYTSVINERHYKRLTGYLEEAEQRGTRVIPVNPGNENFDKQQGTYKIPPTLVVNPDLDLKVMREEIFGPIISILTYKRYEETIDFINSQPRPLAAYYFGQDSQEQQALETRTTSGGMCINDVVMHAAQEDLPFGGVGHSGMGNYHGLEGFRTFSHAKSIYSQTNVNITKLAGILPPYNWTTDKTISAQLKK